MQLKNLKTYHLKRKIIIKDNKEGRRSEAFATEAIPFLANLYDKDNKIVSQSGGIIHQTEKRMLVPAPAKILYDPDTKQERYHLVDGGILAAGDGICVYAPITGDPDYRVVSIATAGHLVCRLERI